MGSALSYAKNLLIYGLQLNIEGRRLGEMWRLELARKNPHAAGSYEHSVWTVTERHADRLVHVDTSDSGDEDRPILGLLVGSELASAVGVGELTAASQAPGALEAKERFELWWNSSSDAADLRNALGVEKDTPRDFIVAAFHD